MSEMLKWIEMLLLVLIVLDLGREDAGPGSRLGRVLAAVLQAMIGLYEFRGGSGAPHLWIANYRYFRAFGTFGQPNPFSAFMGLTLPLALGLAWGYALKALACWRNGSDRSMPWARHAVPLQGDWLMPGLLALLYAGFALILLVGLIVSWGRGAWLGFGAAAGSDGILCSASSLAGCAADGRCGALPLMLVDSGIDPGQLFSSGSTTP